MKKDKEKNNENIYDDIRPPKCSFCGKHADKVGKIIQGLHNMAYICDECVKVCFTMLLDTERK